jgi:hypothetical protein
MVDDTAMTGVLEQLRRFKIYMVFHTHWDREWYSTATVYQHRTVEFMQRVLEVHAETSTFPAFYLDGQTCILDDYLRICPGQRQHVARMVAAGRLQIGPWYVQPEEHQPSGESHIRNLELGLGIARDFGDTADKIGYLCDPITYVPQMPQLLRQFGIRSLVHGRGITRDQGRSPQEMTAVAPDGSSVFLFHLTYPYYMDFGITYEAFFAKLLEVAQAGLMTGSSSGMILLSSGGDQLYPTGRELDFISQLHRETGIAITPTTLPEYIRLLEEAAAGKSLPQVTEEGIWEHLQDIYAGRIPLKRRIKTCERQLERVAEPLAALAALCGADPQTDILNDLWRRSSENMFHDSIYCAHADEVTRDVEHRCDQLDELLERVTHIALYDLKRLAPQPFGPAQPDLHVLFNTAGIAQYGFHEVEIYTDYSGPQEVTDLTGRPIPALLLSEKRQTSLLTERYVVDSQVYAPPIKVWQRYLLALPELAPASPLVVVAKPQAADPPPAFENVPLVLRDNQLWIKRGTHEYPLEFLLEGDGGDLYTFSAEGPAELLPCLDPRWVRTDGFACLTFALRPAHHRVRCQVTAWMHPATPEIRFRFVFDNQDSGFRIALRVPRLLPGGRHTAHTPYAAVERQPQDMTGVPWCRPGFQVRFPFVEFFGINRAPAGFNVFSPDISNYHVGQNHTVTLALFRSVSDMTTPRFLAGPPLPTPLARLHGESTFDLTVVPEFMSPVQQMKQAWRHNTPLAYVPLAIRERSSVVRPECPPSSAAATLTFPYLQADSPEILLSAFRCIRGDDQTLRWAVRAVNLSAEPTACVIATGFDFAQAWLADLNHVPVEALPAQGRTVSLALRPMQIATMVFELTTRIQTEKKQNENI